MSQTKIRVNQLDTNNITQIISNIAALRLVAPSGTQRVYIQCRTNDGDNGGGYFRSVTGVAVGTYTDNGGTIIVPTGGDGSAAWIRENGQEVNVLWFGAVPDARKVTDIICTGSSAIVTSATANFTVADVGKTIKIYKISADAGVYLGTILSVQSSTQATLSGNAAVSTASGEAIAYWGTDSATAINAALTFAYSQIAHDYGQANLPSGRGFSRVKFPTVAGVGDGYIFASTLTTYRNVVIDADAMLFSAVGLGQTDRTWAIQCSAGIQIHRLIMEVGGGMGITNGTALTQSSSYIDTLQIWNMGVNYNAGLTPTTQIGLQLLGFDYTIKGLWLKGGNIGVLLSQASDVRMYLPEIIGSITGIQMNSCENINIQGVVIDTCSYVGAEINGSHLVTITGKAFSVNTTSLTYAVALGRYDTGNANKNINIDLNMQRCGGIAAHIAYCQDSHFKLLGSNSTNYSSGGSALTAMVEYGSGNVGIVDVHAIRDSSITAYSGTRYGVFTDVFMNGTSATTTTYADSVVGAASELLSALGTISGAQALDLSVASNWTATLGGNVTFTFTNTPATGVAHVTIQLTQDSTGGRTVTWPASVRWNSGTIPSLTSLPNTIDIFSFASFDHGTTWNGWQVGKDMA